MKISQYWLVFQGTRVGVLHDDDDDAQTPKHIADTHKITVYNRYFSFSSYWKVVWSCRDNSTKASLPTSVSDPGIDSALRSSFLLKGSHILAKHYACCHLRKSPKWPAVRTNLLEFFHDLAHFPSVLQSRTTNNIPQSPCSTFKIILISQLNEFFRVYRTFSESLTPILQSSRQQQ